MTMKVILCWLFFTLAFAVVDAQVQPFSRNDSAHYTAASVKYKESLEANRLKDATQYLNEIALLYWNHNAYAKAIEYYEKSLQINQQLGNENATAMIHGNLGLLYADIGKYETSYEHWLKVLAARRSFNNKEGLVEALVNCSVSLTSQKKYKEAQELLLEGAKEARQIKNQDRMLDALLKCYINLSETYEKSGDAKQSRYYYDLYKTFFEKGKSVDLEKLRLAINEEKILKELAENQTKLQQQELTKKESELKLTALNLQSIEIQNKKLDSTLSISELQLKVYGQELELARHQAINDSLTVASAQSEIKREKVVKNSFAFAALSLIAISFFIYRNYVQVKESRKALAIKNETIQSQNKELETLNAVIARHNARMKKELDVGQEIQMSMLPKMTMHPGLDIYAKLDPSREVGGDLYEYFHLDQDHILFGLGDVSGKGVPAALFMAMAKTLIKTHGERLQSPGAILSAVNKDIYHQNEHSMFISYFLARLNLKTGELIYSNAGHLSPVTIDRALNISLLRELHGPVLGIVEEFMYTESKSFVLKHEKFILYTDGVTEALNNKKEFYNEESLIRSLKKVNVHAGCKDIVDIILQDVALFRGDFEQNDDITLLAVSLT